MKIDHVDGGPWTLTLSSQEASVLCYTVPSALAGYGEPDHPLYLEFLRMQQEILAAQLVPGSKDALAAYGEEQAQDLMARVDRAKGIAADAERANASTNSEGSAN